jgi:anti-sigma factor RsiW
MNCEVVHERIVTAAYGELPDEQAHELEQHIEDCEDCRAEREQVAALQVLAAALPVQEPDANLIARARLRLDEALDALPPRRWYERLAQRTRNGFAGLRTAPVAAALVLVVGAGAGSFGGYHYALRNQVPLAAPTVAAAQTSQAAEQVQARAEIATDISDVANVSSVVRHPNSEIVDVSFNQLVPRQLTGSLDDPSIRQLLMMASQNPSSARVRADSVSMLASECRIGHSCQPSGIRDALIVALRYDESPAVREKALEGLEPYVAQDVRVRNAVLEAVMNDTDPEIRTASINLLEPVEADTTVRQVLYSVSNSDANPQIRDVSRQILSQVPEIQ